MYLQKVISKKLRKKNNFLLPANSNWLLINADTDLRICCPECWDLSLKFERLIEKSRSKTVEYGLVDTQDTVYDCTVICMGCIHCALWHFCKGRIPI
jgi:hypothetical protein